MKDTTEVVPPSELHLDEVFENYFENYFKNFLTTILKTIFKTILNYFLKRLWKIWQRWSHLPSCIWTKTLKSCKTRRKLLPPLQPCQKRNEIKAFHHCKEEKYDQNAKSNQKHTAQSGSPSLVPQPTCFQVRRGPCLDFPTHLLGSKAQLHNVLTSCTWRIFDLST